jgi:hypothetical protein
LGYFDNARKVFKIGSELCDCRRAGLRRHAAGASSSDDCSHDFDTAGSGRMNLIARRWVQQTGNPRAGGFSHIPFDQGAAVQKMH